MNFNFFFNFLVLAAINIAADLSRPPLSYASLPNNTYAPPKNATSITLLDFVKSRSDLSSLVLVLEEVAGFSQAFDTTPEWTFTFFAPSNIAFNNTGLYYSTMAATPKGKWWLGNLITHHYVPNTIMKVDQFNTTYQRLQTASYLYVGVQRVEETIMLNNVSRITENDLPVYNGIVHIIDHILDPSVQIFEPEIPKASQNFIAGSCSNTLLNYC